MVAEINEIICSFIPGVVFIIVGVCLERHIYTKIGSDGISVPSAKRNMVKWMYAQAIGPKLIIKCGIMVLIFTALVDIGAPFFSSIRDMGSHIWWIALGGCICVIDNKVAAFSPEWLSNDKEKEKDWVDTAVEFARKRQYKELYEFATSTK